LATLDVADLVGEGTERAAEALEAEVAAVVVSGAVSASVGFPAGQVPDALLVDLATRRATSSPLPGLGMFDVAVVPFDDRPDARLLVARASAGGFSLDERNLLRGMSRVLSLTLREKAALAHERELRARVEEQSADNLALLAALQERQALLERLTRLQRSITRRAPLLEVLHAVVSGAADLIGATVVGLRRVNPGDPATADLVCASGVDPQSTLAARIAVGEGAGGLAIAENRLVVINDYSENPRALTSFAERGLQAAMAAPVHENGLVVGSITVASYEPGRRYSSAEREMLLSFADHASLAITDARIAENLRQALSDARHDAMHDVLTGLPNRALLRDRLSQAWARAARHQSMIALLFLDLDGFKHVNDSLGHDVGDQMLVAVGARLSCDLRDCDTVARLGGDEFAVLVEDIQSADEVSEVADRLLELLTDPIDIDGRQVSVTASIGIALSTGDDPDSQALLRNADLAMYAAKRTGGGCAVTYEPDMHRDTVGRMDLEQALRHAIGNDELLLHYQPIHDLPTGRIVSLEALVRWEHPTRGLVSPAEFIPVAESSGLIIGIGDWVLRQACTQAAQWPQSIQIAVNVSPLQINRTLVDTVRAVLAETGLSPQRLKLEVTEGTAMADSPDIQQVIADLHDLGINFAIDDFGTGHSSLARLRRLPIDQIKIDRSFVADLDNADGIVLVRAIVALARGAGLVAVAEGVETETQLQQLRDLGCDQVQGFLLARPTTAQTITHMLDARPLPQQRRDSAATIASSAST